MGDFPLGLGGVGEAERRDFEDFDIKDEEDLIPLLDFFVGDGEVDPTMEAEDELGEVIALLLVFATVDAVDDDIEAVVVGFLAIFGIVYFVFVDLNSPVPDGPNFEIRSAADGDND